MKNSNNRILPYALSRRLSEDDLKQVSAAGTSVATSNVTFGAGTGTDIQGDITIDM